NERQYMRCKAAARSFGERVSFVCILRLCNGIVCIESVCALNQYRVLQLLCFIPFSLACLRKSPKKRTILSPTGSLFLTTSTLIVHLPTSSLKSGSPKSSFCCFLGG